jgi:hypothetical protein
MRVDQVDDEQLVAALRRAGRALPGASADLGAGVLHGLRSAPRRPRPRRRAIAVVVAVGACLLMAAGAVEVLVPGVNLWSRPPAAQAPSTPLAVDAAFLGTRVTLADARERAGFRVRVPSLPELGSPQVHLAGEGAGSRVSLLYGATADLPALPRTPVGLFITQFRGDVDPVLLTKVAGGAQITPVAVAGGQGWWIEGAHEVGYLAPDGSVAIEPSRFANNTLLWSRDGVTLRLESAAALERAVAIAGSLHARD